ncbi:hypothetical protein [Methylomicrobium sp. Wu6]|uniref:hypothetical protein n=1 Tax=Methylomicrobium sp. Wu6 TaxID=3107928 RepID=UPI002DD6AA11|nr:hypothetical protein [Methylomicrobium sp. Wu6]MEC4747223.1 hypothetical protein [Methylomicrobium sp. Wu6]
MNSVNQAETQQKQPSSRLIPVPEWNNHHSWPPIGGLRHLIFNAETNGFATAFKRVGRRVLIDEAEFFNCIAKQNGDK